MARMDYVEPKGYFTPSAKKILKAGEAKSTAKKTTTKAAPKKSTKK